MSDERVTPNAMELGAKAMLAELLPLRAAETDRRKRKELSRRIKTARSIIVWARTRAGYQN